MIAFLLFRAFSIAPLPASLSAFGIAAVINYWLCIKTIFRHKARWGTGVELLAYVMVVLVGAGVDSGITLAMIGTGIAEWLAKLAGTGIALIANFLGRRFWVFPEPPRGPWKASQQPPAE